MTGLPRLVVIALAAATMILALAGSLLTFPEPSGAIAIGRAELQSGDGQSRTVSLPPLSADRRISLRSGRTTYLARFDLAQVPNEPLFLLVPATHQGFSLNLNGEPIFKTAAQALWSEPMIRGSSLIRLPRPSLRAGSNALSFTLDPGPQVLPSYLSKLYVGSEAALASNFKLRVFVEEQLKAMALAAQALLGIGILIAFLYRPKDPLFAWLAAATLLAFIVSAGLFIDLGGEGDSLRPYIISAAPAVGLLVVGVALALVGLRPPRLLAIAAFAIPVVSSIILPSGILPARTVTLWLNLVPLVIALMTAACIVAWGAVWKRNIDALLMLFPILLLCWFLARDTAVMFGLFDESILIAPYVRPLILIAILAVLMRRLAESLDQLDRANENLKQKLAEREAELAVLHRKDRMEATRLVQERERQRLTRDLHDGISGHLVSIIAMAEKAPGDTRPIEQAARQALDDLRLVIYSLDLGDRELPLALASFRERLVPQLKRMGVELAWSTTELPEVAGVTPGNALMVLRIMQEAVTNALKHGPAHTISIRGTASADGRAVISIENDGRPFAPDAGGFGIENMRRRARQLGGEISICPLASGAKVSLTLPRLLPAHHDE